jgi:predicted amidohydrolase YtcJ
LLIKLTRWLVLPALLVTTACSERQEEQTAMQPVPDYVDLALVNGGIYTVDPDRSWAEAAAVRDGVLVRVGNNTEIEPLIGPQTRVIDLTGRMALPGFHDAHVHTADGGLALMGCDLHGLASVEAIIDKVTACARETDRGWLEGHAFNLGLFGPNGPNKSLLDAISMTRPIVLWASDYHNVWVNSTALELSGITAETPDPPLGVIELDPDGSPSGMLRETAQEMLRTALPEPSLKTKIEGLRRGIKHLNSLGITSFIDPEVGLDEYQAYQAVERAGELTARVVTSLAYEGPWARHRGDDFERVLAGRHAYESERINHGSIKLYLDGVVPGATAALIEPYQGMDGRRGELIFQPDVLRAAVTRFDEMGLQVQMHAIGDLAVQAGLDAIESTRQRNGPSDNRHHLVHLQLIHADDIPRFSALDATANFQAYWAWVDEETRQLELPILGEERWIGVYPIGSVARAGGRIVGGSDWNVTSANPLDAIEAGVRRQDPATDDGPVLNENERVSLATMIDAYTINAAWLMHHEDMTGSIETGKRADFVVLDRDLFAIPATEINDAKVVMTLLDGETVWLAVTAE